MDILKRPMFFAAIVCCVAAVISIFVMPLSFAFLVITAVFLIYIVVYYKKYMYITVVLAIVLFTISLIGEFAKIAKIKEHDREKITGSFLVTEETVDHGLFNSVTLKEVNCDLIPNNVKILIFDYKKTELATGDIVNATIKLSVVDKYNKYRISDYGSGIYATANLTEIEKSGNYNLFYKTAGNIRSYVKNTVTSHFKGDTAGLLVALTTGDKTLLSDKFASNIKTTGISHVVVVSGMHLAIIMMAIFWCMDRLFYNKHIRCVLSIVSVFIIAAVCGFTMSISRAGVMFVILGLAPVFNRENDSLSSLLTAVTIVLIGAPFAVLNVSFQLSVLSTFAIIWVVPFYSQVIKQKLNIKTKILMVFIDTFICSISAIIFTLPVTIKIFGYISIVSPLTNFIIAYPVMIALIFNIAALIVSVIPLIKIFSEVLFFVAGLSARFIVFLVNMIAKLPITVAVLPKSAFWWSVILFATVIGYMYFYNFKIKRSDFSANNI